MGCGCGRSRGQTVNRKAKRAAAQKKVLTERLASASKSQKNKMKKKQMVLKRIKFCRSCPNSLPTKVEKRNKIKVCHKVNVSVPSIINDPKFKCPIGNF